MNKKAYMQPSTAVTIISMKQLVCASPNQTPQVGGTTDKEEDLLSRELKHQSVWDEEEAADEENF